VPVLVVLPLAEAQMEEALAHTLTCFGETKFIEYLDLIDTATQALVEDPRAGQHRPYIHADAWIYPIKQPGRPARHLFLYRIRVEVEVARFLYDGMDLSEHWPDEWR
jgi:plasmid stabilization system protein ParE